MLHCIPLFISVTVTEVLTSNSSVPTIPKILHYIWVGGTPKPQSVQNYIESWYKYCKDWLIVEWNDHALKNINITYVKEAYKAKKWAYVGDYLRLYALYKFGGVYIDADVELLQPIDQFLNASFFMGRENYHGGIGHGTQLIGATPNNSIFSDLLSGYTNEHFLKFGLPNYYVLPTRFHLYFSTAFDFDVRVHPNETTIIAPHSYVYPWWYFCKRVPGKEAWAVHHFHGSWLPKYSLLQILLVLFLFLVASLSIARFLRRDRPLYKNHMYDNIF